MAIIMAIVENGTRKMFKSDENLYIQKEGTDEIYMEAIDLLESEYTYIETDMKIDNNEKASTD